MTMKTPLIAVSVAALMSLSLAGCGGAPEPVKAPPAPPPASTVPKTAAPKPPAPPPPVATPRPVEADSCGARDLQYLIGKPRSEIPVPINPALRRVVCSTCAVTMDFNPQRQTIVFDNQTGIVQSVRCG